MLASSSREPSAAVPKYDRAAEATFQGTVEEVRDRQCPVSGGMASHLILRLAGNKTIEVHLATTKFVKTCDLAFNNGYEVTVVGTKVQFEGVETIFACEVTRGGETFVPRQGRHADLVGARGVRHLRRTVAALVVTVALPVLAPKKLVDPGNVSLREVEILFGGGGVSIL